MNKRKSILISTITLLASIALVTSCNQGNPDVPPEPDPEPTINSGLPWTYLYFRSSSDLPSTVKFNYEGDLLMVDWGDGQRNLENSHTYDAPHISHGIIISGDITSITFTDSDGILLEPDNTGIRSVIFSNTITNIPAYACCGLTNLSNAVIPGSVKTIGYCAFFNNAFHNNYTNNTIKSSKNTKGVYCSVQSRLEGWDNLWFYGWHSDIHWGMGIIYDILSESLYVFSHNPIDGTYKASLYGSLFAAENLVINGEIIIDGLKYKVTDISRDAFRGYTNLKSVALPATIENIGDYAFFNCNNLEELILEPNSSLLTIGNSAFRNTELSSIFIPKNLYSFGSNCFENCPIEKVEVEEGNLYFNSGDSTNCNILADNISGELYFYDFTKSHLPTDPNYKYNINIPNAFAQYRTDFATFDFGTHVTSIGGYAFNGSSLKKADLPASLASLGDYAFSESSLETLTFDPDIELDTISYACFEKTSITSIALPKSIKTIEQYAFAHLNLTTLDASVYESVDDIPTMINYNAITEDLKSDALTIKIDSNLTEDDFVNKGWPSHDQFGRITYSSQSN